MSEITVAVPTDLLLPVALLVLVVAVVWTGLKFRALPWEVSAGMASGLARFAKVDPEHADYAEAFKQLNECIFSAWETKDPTHLLPLVANPIAIKAWNNIAPSLRGRLGGQPTEQVEAYA